MPDFLLTQIINYGAPFIGVVLLLGALGMPLPCTLLIIAAGAFARQGILSWPAAAITGLVCVVAGNGISYAIGFYARELVLQRFGRKPRWLKAEQGFQRWGPMSIFLSRFIFTVLAVPVSLLAGTTRFPYRRFIIFDIAGEAVWILGYGGLGYFFGNEWELVSDFVTDFGGLMLGLVLLLIGIRLTVNRYEKNNRLAESRALSEN